ERELVTIHDDGSIHLNMKQFTFHRGLTMTGRSFEKLFGRLRRQPEAELETFHKDVAASIQDVTEKIMIRMARHVREETGLRNLCMAGGVALNTKCNGRMLSEQIFDNVYIQPAAGDAGSACGAALYAHSRLTDQPRKRQPFFSLGPTSDDVSIRSFLDENLISYQTIKYDDRMSRLAGEIANGRIVAIFHGAMEFGPRALGFRSILADPRNSSIKEKINAAVKYREPFRPFAPACLIEKASEYFEGNPDSPYMLFNFQVRQEKRELLPAITHADGSARLQTVRRPDNQVFYDIISQFEKLTGLPVLLNTSFNLRGHPIVCKPQEAFATFCSSGIDILLLGSYLVEKKNLTTELIDRFQIQSSAD
ncbi:MAG: carbamoyltransferase C-terminal domain-containing protein, partial [candidate division Zixibacteria bacterium]